MLLLVGGLLTGAVAEIGAQQTVLIRNVTLVDTGDAPSGEQVVVSLLIRDRVLDVVTTDEIPLDEASVAFDAEGGYLLGALERGESPTFLVLSGDPRGDFAVLRDTATYTRFAMEDGRVVRNALPRARPAGEADRRRGWLAYSPPPVLLPTSYSDTTRWNYWRSRATSGLFAAAVLLDRQLWIDQDDDSREQVGDLSEYDRGEIRGLRFGAVGTFNFERPWVYTFFAATHAFERGFDQTASDGVTLFDYRLDVPLGARSTISVGKQKEPISMERLTSMVYLPMMERSAAADALLPSRNVGVMTNSTLPNERAAFAVGFFNDWFDADQSFEESASQIVGRISGMPIVTGGDVTVVHLAAGVRVSNAREGLRFSTEPEVSSAPLFVDTGWFAAERAVTYNLEAAWRRGPLWFAGEYTTAQVTAAAEGDPEFSGGQVTASWVLTGEMRPYNRRNGTFRPIPVARPVTRGGWGTVELAARWSQLDLSDQAIEGGRLAIASVGFNWWLTSMTALHVNYREIWLDRFGLQGRSGGLTTRVLLALE